MERAISDTSEKSEETYRQSKPAKIANVVEHYNT